MELVTLIVHMYKLESVYKIIQQTILTLVSVDIYTYIYVFCVIPSEVYVQVEWIIPWMILNGK